MTRIPPSRPFSIDPSRVSNFFLAENEMQNDSIRTCREFECLPKQLVTEIFIKYVARGKRFIYYKIEEIVFIRIVTDSCKLCKEEAGTVDRKSLQTPLKRRT